MGGRNNKLCDQRGQNPKMGQGESHQRKRALRKTREIEIVTHAFGCFDALSEQKIDPL